MGKFGITEILVVISFLALIFLFGFWVGKLAGRNAANKEFMNRKS
ncbi:hypothetical protein [Taishania pollutisoli]|nr:hypothetical protein [Taishania pollutisoli]